MKVKVWHGVKHDDCTVSEIDIDATFASWVYFAHKAGGFFRDGAFVPWHRINYAEVMIGED